MQTKSCQNTTIYLVFTGFILHLWLSSNTVGMNCLKKINFSCRHETWSLTLRQERRLGVFENSLLMKIFGPKRDKVTGGWRKFHYEGLYYLYSLPNVIWVKLSQGI
jgi:hypothetical protein